MNIIPDDDKLIGKTIVFAEIGGYGLRLKFNDGTILDYSSSSDGDSCWEIIDDDKQAERGEEKLKPCPFCGGFGGVSQNIYKTHYRIKCCSCGCSTEYFTYQDDAVEAWNSRAERSEE